MLYFLNRLSARFVKILAKRNDGNIVYSSKDVALTKPRRQQNLNRVTVKTTKLTSHELALKESVVVLEFLTFWKKTVLYLLTNISGTKPRKLSPPSLYDRRRGLLI